MSYKLPETLVFQKEKFDQELFKATTEYILSHQEEVTSGLIDVIIYSYENIKDIAALMREDGSDYLGALYALIALGQFREQSAFPAIIKMVSLGEDEVDLLLGDFITEELKYVIAATYNGDFDLLTSLIDNEQAEVFVRGAALEGLHLLVHHNVIDRAKVSEYFRGLVNQSWFVKSDSVIITFIVNVMVRLEMTEFLKEIDFYLKEELVNCEMLWDSRATNAKDLFRDVRNDAIESPEVVPYLQFNAKKSYASFEEMLLRWHADYGQERAWNDEEEENLWDDKEDIEEGMEEEEEEAMEDVVCSGDQYVRGGPKVGRNDPCPCESGKKFKKCCLI